MSEENHYPSVAQGRVLIVEDDREMCRFLAELLTEEGYQVEIAHDGPAALDRYKRNNFDLTITDLMMPRMKGTELVSHLRETDPHATILLITAFGTIESAVEAMRAGAFHYLTKPFRTDEILINVRCALEQRRLKKEVERLRNEVQGRYHFENIIGKSATMQKVYELVAHICDLSANVLITGEVAREKK